MIKIANYTIGKELEQSDMAIVYHAVQDIVQRDAVVKLLNVDQAITKNVADNLVREGKHVAALGHSNLVRVYTVDSADGVPFFIAMEYFTGGSLAQKLRQGKLSFSQSLNIVKDVAAGLSYAHKKGYIHNNIKPSNILFREKNKAILSDFALASLKNIVPKEADTATPYSAPELSMSNNKGDKRSDIYSLGAVFYEMMTGKQAVCAESMADGIPPILPDESAYLQGVINKALAKIPAQRYQTIDGFLSGIKQAIAAEEQAKIYNASQRFMARPFPIKTKKKNTWLPLVLGGAAVLGVFVFANKQYADFVEEKQQTGNLEQGETKQPKLLGENLLAEQPQVIKLEKERALKQQQLQAEEARRKQQALVEKQREAEALQAQQVAQANEDRNTQQEIKPTETQAETLQVEDKKEASQLSASLTETVAEAVEDTENDSKTEIVTEVVKEAEPKEETQQPASLTETIAEAVEDEKKEQSELEENEQEKQRLAQQKIEQEKKVKIAAEKKRKKEAKKAKERKRKRKAELAKAKAEKEKAKQKSVQEANKKGKMQLSATLDGRPYSTYFVISEKGQLVKSVQNRAAATLNLPAGRYAVTAHHAGKPITAVMNLAEGAVVAKKFAFSSADIASQPAILP